MISKKIILTVAIYWIIVLHTALLAMEVEDQKITNTNTNIVNLNIIEIDDSLLSQEDKLIEAYNKIKQNLVGSKLLECLNSLLIEYPNKFINIVKDQGKVQKKNFIDEDDEQNFDKNKHLIQKILLTKGESTLFKSSHKITDFQDWSKPSVYKKFTPTVYLKDINEVSISVFRDEEDNTSIETTPFYMVLAHELIHAIDFLKDPYLFNFNSTVFSEEIIEDWNLDFLKNDQYGFLWDGRNTEFLAVLGRCTIKKEVGSISELTMRIADNMPIRVPYITQSIQLSTNDKKYIIENGKKLFNLLVTK